MAKILGRSILLLVKIDAAFVPIAALTGKNLSVNNEQIDATAPDPDTPEGVQWRESLAGTKAVDMSGDYTLVSGNAAQAKAIEIAMAENPTAEFQMFYPTVGTWEGVFFVNLQLGEDGKGTGSISLSSDGAVTFTAVA
ncbi:phage major tail protein, TP901-1 family [Leisingera sp. NJS201]|uniref:phage tail tube protein n=1 Tax=Leisingera sp. NJS201 TaxID=2508306 RepID=UPI001070B202|nr:phage tail tube protein [Leisingera sp. NJS201]QBR35408.1 phage major tail protein, TP901-1 family [Leisingera sp. NJS201]